MATATKSKPKSKARKIDLVPSGASAPADMFGIPTYGYTYYDWDHQKHRVFKTLDSAVVQASLYLRNVISDSISMGLSYGIETQPDVDIMKNGTYYGTIYLAKDLQTPYLLPRGSKRAYPIMVKGGVVQSGPINRAALKKLTAGYFEE